MKVLFLDIDGVVNSAETFKRRHKEGGRERDFDERLSGIIKNIVALTGCKVVLSSSWRGSEENEALISEHITPLLDRTPRMHRPVGTGVEYCGRGKEIKAWLEQHPEITRYAIIDDDSDMMPEQIPYFFQTTWQKGITEEIASEIIAHLGKKIDDVTM